MIEQTRPPTAKGSPQQQSPKVTDRIPSTSPVVASACVRRIGTPIIGPGVAIGGAAGPEADVVKKRESSGTVPAVCQLVPPSTSTLVSAFTRPSAIHWRNCSVVTGPYSLPSAPMILYMREL